MVKGEINTTMEKQSILLKNVLLILTQTGSKTLQIYP